MWIVYFNFNLLTVDCQHQVLVLVYYLPSSGSGSLFLNCIYHHKAVSSQTRVWTTVIFFQSLCKQTKIHLRTEAKRVSADPNTNTADSMLSLDVASYLLLLLQVTADAQQTERYWLVSVPKKAKAKNICLFTFWFVNELTT